LACSVQACYSRKTASETKHIVQLKELFLLICEYAESHQGKSPRSLHDLGGLIDEDGLRRLIYFTDGHNSPKEWIYIGAVHLEESPTKILIEGPIRYDSGKKIYLSADGHAFLK
jgi:hypothetical protein